MSGRSRRARGLGSVRQIAKGKYRIAYDVPREGKRAGERGSRRQRYELVFGTKTEADNTLQTRLAEVRSGGIPDEDRLTFDVLADRYLIAKAVSREATTVALYRRVLAEHVRPELGEKRLRDIRTHHIATIVFEATNRGRTTHKGEPLSAATQRNLLTMIRAVLAWGVKQGHLIRNVASNVETPASQYVERAVIGLDDVRALLAAAAGTELAAIVPVAIGTGLRRSELCALHWGDVDLEHGIIHVRRAAANLGGAVIVKAPKTRRSKRVDTLPAFVVAVLRRQRIAQEQRHASLGGERPGAEHVIFDRLDGRSWDPNELSRQFSRLIRREKLPAFRFHDLRHGYATLAFAAGVPLKTVSESLGHSAIGVTSAIYVHLRDEARHEKAHRLDAYLENAVATIEPAAIASVPLV